MVATHAQCFGLGKGPLSRNLLDGHHQAFTNAQMASERTGGRSRPRQDAPPLAGLYTCKTSPSRATISYNTGLTKKPINSREINPATMTIAKGFWVSEPMP